MLGISPSTIASDPSSTAPIAYSGGHLKANGQPFVPSSDHPPVVRDNVIESRLQRNHSFVDVSVDAMIAMRPEADFLMCLCRLRSSQMAI